MLSIKILLISLCFLVLSCICELYQVSSGFGELFSLIFLVIGVALFIIGIFVPTETGNKN